MEGTKKIQPAQSYDQSVAIPKEVDGSGPKTRDLFEVGGRGGKRVRKISIPPCKVFDGTLGTHSARAAAVPPDIVPRYSGVHPVSLLWFTVENVKNLPQDEIVESLFLNDKFTLSKLAIVLSLPEGDQIAGQVVECIPGDRLLKLLGENRASLDDCLDLLFEKKWLERIALEFPTVEEIKEYLRVACGFSPEDLQNEEVNGPITALAQTMTETYADEDRRRGIEGEMRKVVDSIFSKLPPPSEENQKLWDNILKAMHTKKSEKKLKEIRKRFPLVYLVLLKKE
ncbi:MAG: hypothetical protein LBI47_03285 [Puniceicoccales bacterium]|jgi:hypothetical protein|nr:hypothetical protein [Puniceicoccales bacterium]